MSDLAETIDIERDGLRDMLERWRARPARKRRGITVMPKPRATSA